MKKLLLILFAFTLSVSYAQEKNDAKISFTESTVNSLMFSVDSPNEFKTINWKDIKEIFSENKKIDSISLGFELKKSPIRKTHYSFTIKGKSDDIDGLIKMSKKAIRVLNKI